MLSKSEMMEYSEVFPVHDNGLTHVNHNNCSAGVDRKKRLYMRRVPAGVLFYCQHCGEKGFLRTDGRIRRVGDITHEKIDEVIDTIREWENMRKAYERATPLPECDNTNAKLWIYSYGFSDEDVMSMGIRADSGGVYLPIYHLGDSSKSVIGYQYRRLSGTGGPKYITAFSDRLKEDGYGYLVCGVVPNVYVICEDILSAYKVSLSTAAIGVVTFGTTLPDKFVTDMAMFRGDATVIMWYDDDHAGLVGAVKGVRRLLDVTTKDVAVKDITGKWKQPKELSYDAIREIVKGVV